MSKIQPREVSFPAESRIASSCGGAQLSDAFSIDLPVGAARDPELLARFIFSRRPRWVAGLMAVRDALAAPFGLKTGRALGTAAHHPDRVGIFELYDVGPHEAIVGEDDTHLDFRASVLCRESAGAGGEASLTLSTVVHCHNALGRAYIVLIAPFHRLVKSFLRQAARSGWPRQPGPLAS